MNKTAAFDFKMRRDGVEGMYVAGVDYLQLYRLKKAAEDDETDTGSSADKSESNIEKIGESVSNTVLDIFDVVPMGFLIGGGSWYCPGNWCRGLIAA